MASVNHICHLCEEEDVSNVAVVWCADCETFLCKACASHHSRSKASKRHQTIALDDYKKLPSFIVDIKSRCEKHDEKYDFYCKFHGDPCCVKCIKDNHKDCRDFDLLIEVLRDIKTSAKVSNLDKEFNILLENFEKVVKYLNFRITTLCENKIEFVKQIQNLRSAIIMQLDEIEKEIVDDLSLEINKMKLKFNQFNTEIENKKKDIKNLQNDLSRVTMYATDLQIYVCLQFLEKSISTEVIYLQDLQRNGQLDDIRIESKLPSHLKSLTNIIRTFGTAVQHLPPCPLKLKTSGEYQVHLSPPTFLTIDSIQPKLKTTFKIPISFKDIEIYGCQVLPDGRILILDAASKRLLLFSKDGDYIKDVICLEGEPSDICYIKGNLIAVTIHFEQTILLIDISQQNITKTIKVTDECFGIDSNGETLVVNLVGSEVIKLLTLDLDGNILSAVNVPGMFSICIALNKKNMICTDWNDNLISCYSNNGILLWTHQHEDIREPFGITVNKHGFTFVACRGNDRIIVLSEDGKTSKTILSKESGLDSPHAISIDKTSSTLLVTNFSNGDAYLFDI
ncbi:Hypothetical predicted protein [Mytilus galloprovincialis]|uniref:B box-type domain-containing protein n=1 Tax=Mytilus galloprovincialis TaxID=29158 RepID=A0A8B6G5Y5_MYTGA|nr:Hypothetical predicted protein [Mytilus galloprovincialis]